MTASFNSSIESKNFCSSQDACSLFIPKEEQTSIKKEIEDSAKWRRVKYVSAIVISLLSIGLGVMLLLAAKQVIPHGIHLISQRQIESLAVGGMTTGLGMVALIVASVKYHNLKGRMKTVLKSEFENALRDRFDLMQSKLEDQEMFVVTAPADSIFVIFSKERRISDKFTNIKDYNLELEKYLRLNTQFNQRTLITKEELSSRLNKPNA